MRFIGNKENLCGKIHEIIEKNNIYGKTFFDIFAGTTSVSKYFKKLGYKIICADLLYLSYCLQRAYIVNNKYPRFDLINKCIGQREKTLFDTNYEKVIEYLNNTKGLKGFIYKNYSPGGTSDLNIERRYLSDGNAKKIDGIRSKINEWKKKKLIDENEYYILLACLIESISFYTNVAGVYAAFQKSWDPRALKEFRLRKIEIIQSKQKNIAYNCDSVQIIEKHKTDILYLDPPYNHRQYAPNYHLIETIAKYDEPNVKGVAGLRDYKNEKSLFCNRSTALNELEKIANKAKYKYLIMSYNSEGLMKKDEINGILSKYGNLKYFDFEYLRFRSNNNGEAKQKKYIKEQLYILEKK